MVNEIIGTINAIRIDPGTMSAPAVVSVVLYCGGLDESLIIATGKVGKRLGATALVGDRIVATLEGAKIISFELNSGK
jgi:hypothetical protein